MPSNGSINTTTWFRKCTLLLFSKICLLHALALNLLSIFSQIFSRLFLSHCRQKFSQFFFSYSLLYIVLINMYTHFNFQVKEKITKKKIISYSKSSCWVCSNEKERKEEYIWKKKFFFWGESESHTEMNFSKQKKKISSVVWIRNELKHFYVLSWLEVYFSHHEFRNLLETWKNSQFYLIANWREKKFF